MVGVIRFWVPTIPLPMRWLYASLWLLLVADLALLSPPPAPEQGAWIQEALRGQWHGKNPATIALFNIMGLWPFAFASRLSGELRARLPAWPFVLGSVVVGAFALLPYLVLRPTPPPGRDPGWGLRWLAHPAVLAVLGIAALGMAGWGLLRGDLAALATAFRTEQLVQVMSLDCAVLALVFGLSFPRALSGGDRPR